MNYGAVPSLSLIHIHYSATSHHCWTQIPSSEPESWSTPTSRHAWTSAIAPSMFPRFLACIILTVEARMILRKYKT